MSKIKYLAKNALKRGIERLQKSAEKWLKRRL
jgi:hypothetical protein